MAPKGRDSSSLVVVVLFSNPIKFGVCLFVLVNCTGRTDDDEDEDKVEIEVEVEVAVAVPCDILFARFIIFRFLNMFNASFKNNVT